MAREICERGGDALVLAGDIAGRNLGSFRACLDLFASFPGARFFLAGNHDLWSPPEGSAARYERVLAEVGAECGFSYLEHGPAWVGDVALVGTVGWYDYSLRDESLVGVPLRHYERKQWPNVSSWNDRHWIDWHWSDTEFTEICLANLSHQLDLVRDEARSIAAVMHHLPFAELVTRRRGDDAWAFCNAFMGSSAFGQMLLDEDKVGTLFCGHSHHRCDRRIGHLRAISNGSNYEKKTYEMLSL